MLVIGREVGEVINIGNDIKLKVLAVEGGTVRFGISAPRNVEIHRGEIYKRLVEHLQKEAQAS